MAAQGTALGPRTGSGVSCTSHICLRVMQLSPTLSAKTLPFSCSLRVPGHQACGTPGDGPWSVTTGEVLPSILGARGWLGSGMFPGVGMWTTRRPSQDVRWPVKNLYVW